MRKKAGGNKHHMDYIIYFSHQKEVCDKEKGRENPFEDLDPQRGPYFQVYLKET